MTISKKNLISYREPNEHDVNFILSTWLRGLYYGNDFFNLIDQKVYFENYDTIIKNILSRPTTSVIVCCLKEDPHVILGYAVFEKIKEEPTICHWCFVKSIWRGIGIMKDFMSSHDIKTVTHLTNKAIQIKPKHITFDPFQI